MARILHFHRLAGFRGEIDPATIDWDRNNAEHVFVWRAHTGKPGEDAQEVFSSLKSQEGSNVKLELVAQAGERTEVIQEDVVRVLEVRADDGGVSARLEWAPEENAWPPPV